MLFSSFAYPSTAKIFQGINESNQMYPSIIIFYIFVFALFIPEFSYMISSRFRNKLMKAFENNDGVLDGSDLKEMIGYLFVFYCGKLFALIMLLDMFYRLDVNDKYVYLCFSGSLGTTGIIQFSKFFKK